jgi:hypothetical protein
MILPAALLAADWFGIFRRMTDKQLTAARSELTTAVAAEPKDIDFTMANHRQADVKQELDSIKQERAEWSYRWQTVKLDRSPHSTERVATIEHITELFDRFGLTLVSESPGADGNVSARLSPTLEEVTKRLARPPAGSKGVASSPVKPQLWKVRFEGSYAAVVEALATLTDECKLAVPVRLTMDQAKGVSKVRSWTLLLWL